MDQLTELLEYLEIHVKAMRVSVLTIYHRKAPNKQLATFFFQYHMILLGRGGTASKLHSITDT